MLHQALHLTRTALLVIAAVSAQTATASPFYGLIVDTGSGSGALGAPITVDIGNFYQSPNNGSFPPWQYQIMADPLVAVDSYIALGGIPSNTSSHASAPFEWVRASPTSGVFFPTQLAANQVRSTWFTLPPQVSKGGESRIGPTGGDAVFVARLTVRHGATILAPNVYIAAMTGPNSEPITAYAELNGPSIQVSGSLGGGLTIGLRSVLTTTVDLPGFGQADVYDIYMVGDAPIGTAKQPNAKQPPSKKQPKAVTPKPKPAPQGKSKKPGTSKNKKAPQIPDLPTDIFDVELHNASSAANPVHPLLPDLAKMQPAR